VEIEALRLVDSSRRGTVFQPWKVMREFDWEEGLYKLVQTSGAQTHQRRMTERRREREEEVMERL
jgi:hypothetical protein